MRCRYGALLSPSVFSPNPSSIASHIENYLFIARQHENKWIDVLRHVAWMLKRHPQGADLKAKIFQAQSLSDLL